MTRAISILSIFDQAREKHTKDVVKLANELGYTDTSEKRTWRFDGAKWWPKFEQLGHNDMDVQRCKCITQKDIKP